MALSPIDDLLAVSTHTPDGQWEVSVPRYPDLLGRARQVAVAMWKLNKLLIAREQTEQAQKE